MNAEYSLICCLLKDNSCMSEIPLTGIEFTVSSVGALFCEIKNLLADNLSVDPLVLAAHMESKTGRDWFAQITEIATCGASTENVHAYRELIERDYLKRRAKGVAQRLIDADGDQETIAESIKDLMSLGRSSKNYEYSLPEATKIGLTAIDRAVRSKGALQGVNTGLSDLNEVLGGFHPGDLTIFGARPAQGKTSILLNMLLGANCKVGFFSGEQGVEQISQRMLSIQSKVSLMTMRNGKFREGDWEGISAACAKIKNHPGIFFYDKSSPSIEDIESTARRWKFEYDIRAIYVDYIQKIKIDTNNKNKAQAVGENAGRLKDLARELDIPLIALAQVSRKVEDRTNKRPLMGDLADSSELEKEADQIIMLYRDEVYNNQTQFPGVMELLIEKNRHGATGQINAVWDGKNLSVSDMRKSYE